MQQITKALDKNDRSCYYRTMSKGKQTYQAIVNQALSDAVAVGLEDISLGTLASSLKLSKSGLFAHFKSKQQLQLAVFEEAVARFKRQVIAPALNNASGVARLRALFEAWLDWIEGDAQMKGCLFVVMSTEYADRPGVLRAKLAAYMRDWRGLLERTVKQAIEAGEMDTQAQPEQVASEIIGIALAFHQSSKLLDDADARRRAVAAFNRLISQGASVQ
ncbi:MAG TPA: TetR/AcrR family transcriptional regulator [Roseiflexaceae bacterium]|nr:TetR/AcrR family transcriptional regulator [Roseiflexaceae bacterium]